MLVIGDSMLSFLSLLKPTSIKDYALITAIILVGLMSLLYQLEKSRHKATASEYALFVANTASLGEIQKAKNKADEARQQLIDETIVNSYEASIKQLEAHYEANPNTKYIYINRVQNASSSSSGMSSKTDSAETANAGFNGTQKDTPTRDSEQVQIDSEKAGQKVLQCLELIKWNITPNN
jgi:hypothetical protein